jgi:sugar lactone lactonase YvrE
MAQLGKLTTRSVCSPPRAELGEVVGERYDLALMTRRFVAEPYFRPTTEELRFLPEGPRMLRNYPYGGGKVGWVAIQHAAGLKEGSINVLDLPSGSNTTFPLNGRPGFFAETTLPGVILVGFERQLAYFDLITGSLGETVARIDTDPNVIINDGLAVEGGVLFGTKHLEFNQPLAAVYFYSFDTRKVHCVLDKQVCSNGKFLRRDSEGATLIDIDTIPKRISRYRLDLKLEQVLDRSLVKTPESLPASPDGMRPCPAYEGLPEGGSVVVAYYNPAAVADGVAQQIRLSDGAVLCEWILPGSPRVTCPEFVKLQGKVKLLFTTAVEGMSAGAREQASGAGSIYLADTPFDDTPAPPPLVSA